MTNQSTLFPESQERLLARLDTEILYLLTGHAGGTLEMALDDNEKAVLSAIRFHRGHKNAVTIASIQSRTRINPRTIKEAVRSLRLIYTLPIGSSKHSSCGGYFLIVTDEDRSIWIKDYLDQVRAELAVLRAAAGKQAALELLGQLQLEVQ